MPEGTESVRSGHDHDHDLYSENPGHDLYLGNRDRDLDHDHDHEDLDRGPCSGNHGRGPYFAGRGRGLCSGSHDRDPGHDMREGLAGYVEAVAGQLPSGNDNLTAWDCEREVKLSVPDRKCCGQ